MRLRSKTFIKTSLANHLALLFLCLSGPAFAADLTVGGAWRDVANSDSLELPEIASASNDLVSLPVSFTSQTNNQTESELTIGYTMPALGTFTLDVDNQALNSLSQSITSDADSGEQDTYGAYATSFMGGQLGVFGGVTDQQSVFSLGQTTSRTFGAAVGYAGFYVRGAYQDAGSDGLIDGRRAWQAGLGYGSGAFDVRVTYVESAFTQGGPTDIEGKQWMIGGLVEITPSLMLNANAFYVDREVAMPTVEPPGTGARVGLQLRF